MKFLPFVLKNVFRNKRRTILTMTSIAASLFLVATLLTVLSELQDPPATPDSALRLITRHGVSLANILPISYKDKIAAVPGVEAVCGTMWFQGEYKDPGNFFPQMAVTPEIFDVLKDMRISQAEKEAFMKDRTGAIAGRALAKRWGWKLGDRIVLKGTIFQMTADLTLRGIYDAPDESQFYFHWAYFDEGFRLGRNMHFCGMYWIKAKTAEDVPKIAKGVDDLFRNSTYPTKTESEKAFVLGFLSMYGNVQLLITSICSGVIFAIVLVAANTMAMSIRERTREIGILKALGFRRPQVLTLLLSESVAITLGGALVGSLGARLLFSNMNMAGITNGFIQRFLVRGETLVICAAIGLGLGILSAGIPAWQAARRPVVDALRRIV
jgi:putative ABC transport system permease protein